MPGRIPMTARQRAELLALPDSEAMVVRHYGLDPAELAAVAAARTQATRLGYALQLCALRYPGRHLRRGELLPVAMLDHIAEQVGVEADVIADFARRTPTRYDQLAAIKMRFGFRDLSRPLRADLMTWLSREAETLIDGRVLLDRLLTEMRARRIVIPGLSVVERMAAEAMHRADAAIDADLGVDMRARLDALIDDKVHERQSRLSWLREPTPRVSSASLGEILEKVAVIRQTGAMDCPVEPRHGPRLQQFAREGVRYTAQAFQQMRPSRRRVVLFATLRKMEATLTDAAIAMFGALVGRAHLRARKRLEQRVAASGREGRERLARVASVLEAITRAARSGADIALAVQAIAPLETIEADAGIIRRSASLHKSDVLEEIAARLAARSPANADLAHARGDVPRRARLPDRRHPCRAVGRLVQSGSQRAADGQAFYLGGPGEAGGVVNAHYGRDPVVKIYTTVTDRYAPLHQTVIAGTAGEAIHALDGILGHDSDVDLTALHVDGGGVSDIVFAVMHLLGLRFEPRIPRLSDRRLYAFEPPSRYGRLAPLFGRRLNRDLIVGHWSEIELVIGAMRDRTVTPSLILRKLAAYRQQNSLAAALREVGRIERTLFTLRWFEDPGLRRAVTAELNKGEARNSLARAVAFHRLGRFRDRGQENQKTRAAALNLVTAAIVLFNCRYLGCALDELRRQGRPIDPAMQAQLSPLGWDRINLTGDYVWSDRLDLDADGLMPLLGELYRESMSR